MLQDEDEISSAGPVVMPPPPAIPAPTAPTPATGPIGAPPSTREEPALTTSMLIEGYNLDPRKSSAAGTPGSVATPTAPPRLSGSPRANREDKGGPDVDTGQLELVSSFRPGRFTK
jgi:hypothetical protein